MENQISIQFSFVIFLKRRIGQAFDSPLQVSFMKEFNDCLILRGEFLKGRIRQPNLTQENQEVKGRIGRFMRS